jgi:hypothetical protein
VAAYRNHIYPYLVSRMGDPKPIRELRQRVIPLAEGRVLIRPVSRNSTLSSPELVEHGEKAGKRVVKNRSW